MSFGGGSTSDIGDPRSGEATYAGTSSVAGTAQQMGRDVADVEAAIDYYDQVMSMADDGQQNDANFVAAVSKGVLNQMPAPVPQSLPLYKDPEGVVGGGKMGARNNASTILNVRTPNFNMPHFSAQFYRPTSAFMNAGNVQQALTDFERNLGLNMMGRAADRQTTVTGMGTQPYGFAPPLGTEDAMTMSSLDQLGRRAGGSGAFEQTPFGYVNDFGTKMAGSMYKDIAEKGYIPQYDSRGQIVATINPQTGQYGVGSVAGRIDPNNPANIEERMALEGSGVTAPEIAVFSDDDSSVPMGAPMGVGGGVAEAVTPDISMIPTGQIAAGGTPMYRQTLLDVAPTEYGGLLAGQTASDFDAMNRAFRMTGATYPEYFQDPYNLTGYSILT